MRQLTRERYRRAAIAYGAAVKANEPCAQAVAAALGITDRAAGNLIRRARQNGFIAPTDAGRPAKPDHVAAVATIHRNRTGHRSWKVCETCLTPWPCGESRRS